MIASTCFCWSAVRFKLANGLWRFGFVAGASAEGAVGSCARTEGAVRPAVKTRRARDALIDDFMML
jgi:hypothetical protein